MPQERKITAADAIKGPETALEFFELKPDTEYIELIQLRGLIKDAKAHERNSKRQSSLTKYFAKS